MGNKTDMKRFGLSGDTIIRTGYVLGFTFPRSGGTPTDTSFTFTVDTTASGSASIGSCCFCSLLYVQSA